MRDAYDKSVYLDRDSWRRGIPKPHCTTNCPICLGLSHQRGRHFRLDQAQRILRERQRQAGATAPVQ
jgi:hypothetical protein